MGAWVGGTHVLEALTIFEPVVVGRCGRCGSLQAKALPELQRHALADNILDRFRERTGEAMPAPRGGRGARGRGRGRGGRGSAACP